MSARPNFFIVGAPKCGTSSMYTYLSQHPDVCMSTIKEPHHFDVDLDEGRRGDNRHFVRDRDTYLALFSHWRGEQRVGEGSTLYLYSRVASTEIRSFDPDALIIVMLREPIEAMYALHAQRLTGGSEDIRSFSAALQAEDERRRGLRIPKNAWATKGLLYRDVFRYANQVERYLTTFGGDRTLVLLFEDFVADPGKAYREVCGFLGIDSASPTSFERVNASKVVRSLLLRDLITAHPRKILNRRPPEFARRWWNRGVEPALTALNVRAQARQPLDPQLRDRLARELAPDVERLARLLDRDLLSIWNIPDPGA